MGWGEGATSPAPRDLRRRPPAGPHLFLAAGAGREMGFDPFPLRLGQAAVDVPGEQLPDPLVAPLPVIFSFAHGLLSSRQPAVPETPSPGSSSFRRRRAWNILVFTVFTGQPTISAISGVGEPVVIGQLDDRPLLGRERAERPAQHPRELPPRRQALRLVAVHGIGAVRIAVLLLGPPGQRLERLVVGDAEDPGRGARAAVEARGPLPDGEHDVVEHLFHQLRPAGHLQQVAEQAPVIQVIERLEGLAVLRGHLAEQRKLVGGRHARSMFPNRRQGFNPDGLAARRAEFIQPGVSTPGREVGLARGRDPARSWG